MPNKVKYGLKNVHIQDLATAQAPVALPGAVSLTLTAEGDTQSFFADDGVYYRSRTSNGYSGTLEMPHIPEWFREKWLGESVDDHGLLVERTVDPSPGFALLFELTGDAAKSRHVIYGCTVSRPTVSERTAESSRTPQTESLELTAQPYSMTVTRPKNGYMTRCSLSLAHAKAYEDSAKYADWFTSAEPLFSDADIETLGEAELLVPLITFLAHPESLTVEKGTQATFRVVVQVNGGNAPTYQWQAQNEPGGLWGNTSLSGNKTDTLSFLVPNPGADYNGRSYRCAVTDSTGHVWISNPALLTTIEPQEPEDSEP